MMIGETQLEWAIAQASEAPDPDVRNRDAVRAWWSARGVDFDALLATMKRELETLERDKAAARAAARVDAEKAFSRKSPDPVLPDDLSLDALVYMRAFAVGYAAGRIAVEPDD